MDSNFKVLLAADAQEIVDNGGEGSGNFGHEGRPGEIGGSGEGGGGGKEKKEKSGKLTADNLREWADYKDNPKQIFRPKGKEPKGDADKLRRKADRMDEEYSKFMFGVDRMLSGLD